MIETADSIALGDLQVFGRPPAKLLKAVAVLAMHLHPVWAQPQQQLKPGWSKRSCILMSLTVREFLYKIGFRDADFVPTFVYVDAMKDAERQHSAGIGDPDHKRPSGDGWTGHSVVVVGDWMIDTTLYQINRPAWAGLPGMVCLPIFAGAVEPLYVQGHEVLSGFHGEDPVTGNEVKVVWMRQPQNEDWRRAPDVRLKHRRENVVRQLVAAFGKWSDE